MTRRGRRATIIATAMGVAALGVALIFMALGDSVAFYVGPSEALARHFQPGVRVRLGGMVKDGSVVRSDHGQLAFVVTDGTRDVAVTYVGLVPDLFREGQGVVAEGVMATPAQLKADVVLAKHDEKYMPREVAEALKKQGWKPGQASP